MKIDTKVDDKTKTVTCCLDGELDVHHGKLLKNSVGDLLSTSPDWTYVIDLQKVNYIDSSGLGILVFLKKEVNKVGGQFKIINVSESIRSVFQLTKLDEYFGII